MSLEEDLSKYKDVVKAVFNFIDAYASAFDDYELNNTKNAAYRFIDGVYEDKSSYHNKSFKLMFDQVGIRRRNDYLRNKR